MKTKVLSLFAIALSAAFLFSCDKDETEAPPSSAQFGADKTTAMVHEEIQFINQSSNATSFNWSFGDGNTSTEVSPKHAYGDVGVYLVSLVSTGAGGSTTQNISITVVPAPSFTVEDEDNLQTLTPVQFTNTSEGADSYLWEFGDSENTTSTDEHPTFAYSTAGVYTVTLTAVSEEGESSVSKEVTIGSASEELFFIEYGNSLLNRISLDGSGSISTFMDLSGMAGVGLDYDPVGGKIYFSDFEVVPEGKIWRMNLDGTGLETIVSGIDDPYGIALDLQHGKIYWTDDAGNISRSNLDGSDQQIGIVNITDGLMRAIDLDPANNKMYFYEVNNEDLYVADLDGGSPTVLVPGVYGYAIKVDATNGKIYFDDQNTETMIMANLDGSQLETFDSNGTRIYGMDIDEEEGLIYWSGRDSGELKKANLDGSGAEVIASGLNSPRGIFLRK